MFKQLLNTLFPHLTQEQEKILNDAQGRAQEIILQSKEESLRIKQKAEEEVMKLTAQITGIEKNIAREESKLEQEKHELNSHKAQLDRGWQDLEREKKRIEERKLELMQKFEKLAKMSPDEARTNLLSYWEQKLKTDIVKSVREADEQIKRQTEERAKEILVDSMRYGVTDYVVEYTLSTVALPSEDFKGRIIGKEGRNIRAFELATGVEVDLDEEGMVKLSSFDPIKREIARVVLEHLIKDGRVQPARIEEMVKKTKEEIRKIIFKEGEKLCYDLGVYNLPQELIELLGRFKYRFSYGQNMIQHTMEETKIGVALAHELGADINIVRLACLLHDIGKVITDKEGSHIQLGVDLLKRHHFPQKVVDAVASHHEDKEFTSVEAIIVYLADAISGGRPGARREDVTSYITRMKSIEDFIKVREGVEEVSVLQAGREIRVIINPSKLDDEQTVIMCSKLKDEIEKSFSAIPGQIKITAIREFRTTVATRS
ncbi:MAG: ribonuclease Y [Patescibacteria group bacterium]